MTQEDYKPVLICVHCCQIPIYTAVMSNYVQLQIIITWLYIESMPVYLKVRITPMESNERLNEIVIMKDFSVVF